MDNAIAVWRKCPCNILGSLLYKEGGEGRSSNISGRGERRLTVGERRKEGSQYHGLFTCNACFMLATAPSGVPQGGACDAVLGCHEGCNQPGAQVFQADQVKDCTAS